METYQELLLTDIVTSPDNPRIINDKAADFLELVESIRALGVIVPVHVRIHSKQKDKFEMLAGERRLLAAAKTDRTTIKAINYGTINDEQAFEISFVENFGRADLTPLEQSKAANILLQKYKGDVEAAASKLGKSVRWILQRVAIDKNLSNDWKQAIADDSMMANWTASHLQLIAALPQDLQDSFLANEINYTDMVPTVKELEEQLADTFHLLSKAPWATWATSDSKLLKDVPACTKCSKRSSARPGLFDDTLDKEAIKKNDRCLDQNCWSVKLNAHIQQRSIELGQQHPNLVFAVMPDQHIDYYKRQNLSQQFGYILNEWKSSKEDAKDALPALIVFGKNAGELRWIKPIGDAIGKRDKSRPIGPDGKPKPTPLKQRRIMLDKKRWFVVIRNVIEEIEKLKVDDIACEDKIFTVMLFAAVFGTEQKSRRAVEWDKFIDIYKKAGDDSTQDRHEFALIKLWNQVSKTLQERLTYCGAISQTPDEMIAEVQGLGEVLGIDVTSIFKKVSQDVYPEPKSWKSLNANGSPKKKKPKTK